MWVKYHTQQLQFQIIKKYYLTSQQERYNSYNYILI